MSKFYTGIGSRSTPPEIIELMTKIAVKLEEQGWTLRSGGAGGADIAFEKGVNNLKEIYLPWPGFNNSTSTLHNITNEAKEIASENHEAWEWLKPSIRKLMTRNVYQVLGYDLNTHSSFLICYTSDGCEHDETRTQKTGGTGLAISVASKQGIPIFNLKNEASLKRVSKLINP